MLSSELFLSEFSSCDDSQLYITRDLRGTWYMYRHAELVITIVIGNTQNYYEIRSGVLINGCDLPS